MRSECDLVYNGIQVSSEFLTSSLSAFMETTAEAQRQELRQHLEGSRTDFVPLTNITLKTKYLSKCF